MSMVELGRFGRPHGVRGEIRLWPHNLESPALEGLREVHVGPDVGQTRPMRFEDLRADAKGFVARLAGVTDRDQAAALAGLGWYVPRAALPATSDDEVYVVDLVGLPVRTEEGRAIGTLSDVWSAGGGELLVIRDGAREHLVPNVAEFVVKMDLEAREIVIRAVDGLLDE